MTHIIERMKRNMVIFVIIVQFIFMVFYCYKKDFFDGDEMFSYSLSNGNYTPFLRWNKDWWNQWHEVDYLTKQITVTEEDIFDYSSVVYNQTQDVHPPVYYCILHTICSLNQGHFSKWQGLSINLFFYILALFVIYKVAFIMLENKVLAIFPMLSYGLSAGAVTTVIYIRMYMLLTLLCVLDVYLHFILLGKYKYKNYILMAIFFTTVLGGLTQYYFLVFAFISSTIYCVIEFGKSRRCVVYYGIVRICSLILSFLLFPSALMQITAGSRGISRISGICGNLSNIENFKERIYYYISFIEKQLFVGNGLQIEIVIIMIAVVIKFVYGFKRFSLRNKLKINTKSLFLSCQIVMYLFFVINYAPKVGKGFRYIVNIYPLILLNLYYILLKIIENIVKSEYFKSVLKVFCILTVCVSVCSNKAENIEYLHSSNIMVTNNLKNYNTSANYFINKSDSQEYSFWMQYQNMIKKENQKFIVTTYNRILEMDNQCLNQTIFEKYDGGILFYIITSYSQQEAENILDEIIERTELREKDYIGTVDGERIFFCRK